MMWLHLIDILNTCLLNNKTTFINYLTLTYDILSKRKRVYMLNQLEGGKNMKLFVHNLEGNM